MPWKDKELANAYHQRWLKENPEKRRAARRKQYARDRVAVPNTRPREPWTTAEIALIMRSKIYAPSDRELALQFGRSIRAIQAARERERRRRRALEKDSARPAVPVQVRLPKA